MEAQRKARLYENQRQSHIQVAQAEPRGPVPSAGAGCGLPAMGRAHGELTVVLMGTVRLRVCLVSPLPSDFPPAPSLCSALAAQSCSRIKSSPSLAPSWCSKAQQEQWYGCPSAKTAGHLPARAPASLVPSSSGSSPLWKCGSAEQTGPLPARSGFGFSFPGLQDLLLLLISLDGSIPRGAKGTWQVT